ncbi:cyclodeaminase/cyclohydrolase family protein [Fusibacter paucivorans]|uniref:Cyclodeaminase/cyclohydrolase family protein n=1 Tax=Fusibacter paucivorans TaxID=76009 RepID=A0ABS5PS11_9FIRM|nr:cyclodeaminase/cyclohydrolase family protein [Fusibacter paucivorans]MBS7527356.1 cyclodeaminase/cyclohydrolase family protein [Fusibacter paucivorans]
MFKQLTLEQFIEETASGAPVPGGGSVAALTGSLSAALSAMVANLTVGKKKYAEMEGDMTRILASMSPKKDQFLALIDKDSAAFDLVMKALKMPKETEADAVKRQAVLQSSLIDAADAPYAIAELAASLFEDIETLVVYGNSNAQTDALVAAMLARTAIHAALYNVKINLLSIKDESYVTKMREKVNTLSVLADEREKAILSKSSL